MREPPHQSSGPILGRVLLDAPNSTTQLINYALEIKGKPSPSDARGPDIRDERGAPTALETGNGPSATRDLWAAYGSD